jgi:hypothetical protein
LRTQAGVDEPAVESRGFLGCVQADRVLRGAWRAEIIGQAADGQHQSVVRIAARRRHLDAILLDNRSDKHLAPAAVEADHLSGAIMKVVPMGLRQIIELMMAEVHAAGGNLV